MTTVVVDKLSPFRAMTANLDISMDDVVSAFVSKYEENLIHRKEFLQFEIKANNKNLESLHEEVLKEESGNEYVALNIAPFDLTSKITERHINWKEKQITFKIRVYNPTDSGSSYYNNIQVTRTHALKDSDVALYNSLTDNGATLSEELATILSDLRGIARKERQVRGKIAMKKLEDSGYSSLMQDEDLIALVEL